jgi:branched-subunit amino acid transport protein AzlD
MTEKEYILVAIFVMAVANYITRVFPFLFFIRHKPPKFILFIEKNFPPIIMTILVFYTLENVDFANAPYGLKEISAILATILLHLKFGNYLLSIFGGTVFYMILVQFI